MQKADNAESYVLVTSAIFALWNDEEGGDTVEHILHSGAQGLLKANRQQNQL